MPRFRKNVKDLSDDEKRKYVDAVKALIDNGVHSQFVSMHAAVGNIEGLNGRRVLMGHSTHNFLPWHRYLLETYEDELRKVDNTVTIPYWDWTDRASTEAVFSRDFMGSIARGAIPDGPLHDVLVDGEPIRRFTGRVGRMETLQAIASEQRVLDILTRRNRSDADYESFRIALESSVHNRVHVWIGGDMGALRTAVRDPVFLLHHANVDRLWSVFQDHEVHEDNGPNRDKYYSGDDMALMYPWDRDPSSGQNVHKSEQQMTENRIRQEYRARSIREGLTLDLRNRWVSYDRFMGDLNIGEPRNHMLESPLASHAYRFQVTERTTYVIDTHGNADTTLSLRGPQNCSNCFGALLITDSDSGENENNAKLRATLEPGLYHLIVTTTTLPSRARDLDPVSYSIHAQTPLEHDGGEGRDSTLVAGKTIRANLSEMWEVDTYNFEITSAGRYYVFTRGTTDTQILVLTADGGYVAHNDDENTEQFGFNAGVRHFFEPGSYQVDVSGWRTEIGHYEIGLRRDS